MIWKLTDDRPIWIQLVDQLTLRIVSGVYASGAAVPTVRALASEAGVNPNTMQRALAELESRGLVETRRTAGRIVTEDQSLIQSVREELAFARMDEFLASMRALGYTDKQIRELLAAWDKKEELV
ncbi:MULTISPECIES: GntR family transcriptional regulator [Clostridia]|jgi:GntR family transcriptional regulator|uniref:GntR family transcriptional regulator n=1 Tax=Lacrimispora celerecrescens TaxID=29354 RepID=A0A084JQ94_9FIRM|nr:MULTISPECIES: GntR family transcriptional regulator [Clostridia]KEZ91128.1 GntR family transcriptional regulator [Lacrimispora celerecrescens]MBW4847240.1 GntR family transcriptional regulator [Lachnospiraceae bacterium]MSS08902.1 GntR family transcriptional regulator [Clostridium sp. WB02_MRS01]